ncbi:MAG: heterodisulfide reductase-related iron-sulfur binding cluster [Acidobacteriota bacterium]
MSQSQGNISYLPTDGLSYDPAEDLYWDEAALAGEVERAFEVCHGCRMCFKYCDSFPALFKTIDDECDGDVRKIPAEVTEQVMDACFQCKLCEVQCPYTPRDGHEFQLDFPKLVHRYKAHRTRREGVKLRDRVLGDPDTAATAARASFGMANVMNRVSLHRKFLQALLGIHEKAQLPEFAGTTFEKWAERTGRTGREPGEAVLFPTCHVQHLEPQLGRDACGVFEKTGVELRCEKGLACCGMPAWESGDLDSLRKRARQSLDVLEPHVKAEAKVVVINPTCSMMLRQEWPTLLEGDDRERAKALAPQVVDPSEYLWQLRREGRFADTDYRSAPGKVAYHAPCHLRAQGVGFKGRDLIKKIPGSQVSLTAECCGHDGTYGMKVEGFEPAARIGKKAFDGVKEAEAEVWVTDCPLAAIQFEQHAGKRPLHPLSVLARAFREDGFPHPVES